MSARLWSMLRFTRTWYRPAGRAVWLAVWLAAAFVCPAVPAVEFAALVEEGILPL